MTETATASAATGTDWSDWARRLFTAVDSKDSDTFATFFTEDGRFTFGNADTVVGRENVHAAVAGFFTTISALHHDILKVWAVDEVVIVELSIDYTRLDGNVVTVPCVNVFYVVGEKVRDYRIYMDISPVYA